MIEVIFHKRHARCTQNELLTSGSEGITVDVEYSHDFDGLQKAAVFTNGETSIDILNPSDSVTIPWEVLSKVGKRVKMGVYAYNTDGIVIPTVYADLGIVQQGADPNLDENANPTLPVWAEIEEDIDELDSRVTELEQQGGGGFDIHGLTEADTIANDDEIPFHSIEDGEKRKITWSAIKGALKSYFDSIYLSATALVGYATQLWVRSQGYATASDIPDAYTKSQTDNLLDGKQGTISDLAAIRSGAALGATALQSVPNTYRTAAAQDIIDSGKLDTNQGAAHAGKVLGINEDGNVVPIDAPSGSNATCTVLITHAGDTAPANFDVVVYDDNGFEFARQPYAGQPLSFELPIGFAYDIKPSAIPTGFLSYEPATITGVVKNNFTVTLHFKSATETLTEVKNTIQNGLHAELKALIDSGVHIEVPDTWTADNGVEYSDPCIVVDVQEKEDADGNTHWVAIMQRKWASLNAIPFDAPENEEATEETALEGVYYMAKDGSTYTKLTLNAGDPVPYGEHEVIYHNGIDFDKEMLTKGYSRWAHSFYRKYLNSDKPEGLYFTPSHVGDVAPSEANTLRGYILGCSSELKAVAKPIKVKSRNDNGTDIEETVDTFFLPSSVEMYSGNGVSDVGIGEGIYFRYWKNATGWSDPSSRASSSRIIYRIDNNTNAATLRLRTRSYENHLNGNSFIDTSGGASYISYGSGSTSDKTRSAPCFAIY